MVVLGAKVDDVSLHTLLCSSKWELQISPASYLPFFIHCLPLDGETSNVSPFHPCLHNALWIFFYDFIYFFYCVCVLPLFLELSWQWPILLIFWKNHVLVLLILLVIIIVTLYFTDFCLGFYYFLLSYSEFFSIASFLNFELVA